MSNKNGRVKPSKFDTVPEQKLVMRFAEIRQETAKEDARSVEVVIATENPVERYDEYRGIVVREILEMDGIVFRGGRTQLPIVDSHDRSSVANVLGSVRNMRIEGDELVGDAYFASDEESQRAFKKLREGHLTDFSITASPQESAFIERGKQYTTKRGTSVVGPADIVTQWMPTDASLVATGADERSVVRRSYTDIPKETKRMDESMLKPLVALGMPAEITEPGAVIAWVVGHMGSMEVETPEMDSIESAEEMPVEDVVEMAMEEEPTIEKAEDMDTQIEKALSTERARVKEINALGVKHDLERAFTDELISSGTSLDVARAKVLDKIARNPVGQPRVTGSEVEKFEDAARDGLLMRAFQSAGVRRGAFVGDQKPADGAGDFQHLSLRRMAEKFVVRMGGNVDRMGAKDVAMAALGHAETQRRHGISREAYHTTGSFANLLLDASNKTLLAGYEEAPYTWNQWARQASSVADFKNINRIRFSESGDLLAVPETKAYKESPMSDAKESYKVEKSGRVFTVSWETIVNDDLDAISRIPAMQGVAARRTQNKKVYEVLTDNAALSDSIALFNASHSNLAGSTGAPSVTTLNAAFVAMMKQTGLDGATILNIQPSHLIVPVALAATSMELLGSLARPEVGGSAAGNSNTLNIYGPNGGRPLNLVVEPQLDANSATAWYLAASSGQIDTVEITFLQGEESPVLENEWDFDTDCYKYKVRQTFGVKAIDHRGLYKNAG